MTNSELIAAVRGLLNTTPYDHPKVEVEKWEGGMSISITAMYDPVRFTLSLQEVLEELSKLTGFPEIDVEGIAVSGCETCDYGSEYGHQFRLHF